MRKHRLALLGLAVVLSIVGAVFLRITEGKDAVDRARAASVPDTDEARRIQDTILEAYQLYDVARRTSDLTRFPSVFVNDPDVPLNRNQREQLRKWLGEVPNGAGYLTYVTTCYKNTLQADKSFREAMDKAKAEGRDSLRPEDYLTSEELEQIRRSNKPIPTPPSAPPNSLPSIEEAANQRKQNFRFMSMEIDDKKAIVIFETGATRNKATLVRRDGEWYIAGQDRLAVTL